MSASLPPRLAVLALALLFPAPARAHLNSTVQLELEVRGVEIRIALRGTPYDLAPTLEVAPEVRPLPELYRAKPETVLRNIVPYLTLSLGEGRLCRIARQRLEVTPTRVTAHLRYRCSRRPELLELRYDLLFDDDPAHRAFVSARIEEQPPRRAVLDRAHRSLHLEQPGSAAANAWSFLRLGIEHIFTGYDHVLFLVALLLTAGVRARKQTLPPATTVTLDLRPGLRYLLAVVTSFTLAHSLTLALSALEVLSLPPRIVEPAIAITILYVSLENLLLREARYRALLTFGFGLVHGFGFAHILREVGLPQRGLVLSLAAFNLGVELGQLCVVLLLFPAILLLARERAGLRVGAALCLILAALFALLALAGVRTSWQGPVVVAISLAACALGPRLGYRRVVLQGGSLLIAILALLWLCERLLGRALLGGVLG